MKSIDITKYQIKTLWSYLDYRFFAVPEIQREFVWDIGKACKLLDSIYKNLPIGSLMIWETDKQNRDLLRHSLHILPQFDDANNRIWFLLDGQQRLSVLHQVREGQAVHNSNGKIVDFGKVCFILDKERDLRFVRLSRPDPSIHVRIADVLSPKWRWRFRNLPQYKLREIEDCRNRIRDYRVPLIFLVADNLEEVRESFIRVNSLGTPIGAADRAFARASKLDLRHLVNEARAGWSHGFKEISRESVLLALALVYGSQDVGERAVQSVLRRVERGIKENGAVRRQFSRRWRQLRSCLGKSIDYLVQNFGVVNYRFLPSANMVATLAAFFYYNNGAQPNTKQKRQLRKWFWATAVAQRYTGRGYRQNILGDIEFFKRLGRNRRGWFSHRELTDKSEVRLATYSRRSSLTNAFFCLLIRKNPRYLDNGDPVPVEHSTPANRKDKHHIFPRGGLIHYGFTPRQYNSLCNICFVVAEENQSIGDKKPLKYLAEYRHRRHFASVMKSHVIPYRSDSPLWWSYIPRAYRAFVKQRLELICRAFEKEATIRLFRRD